MASFGKWDRLIVQKREGCILHPSRSISKTGD